MTTQHMREPTRNARPAPRDISWSAFLALKPPKAIIRNVFCTEDEQTEHLSDASHRFLRRCAWTGAGACAMSRRDLTGERLREVLAYDPETGIFRWKTDRSSSVRVGDVAGTISKTGYRLIGIDGTPQPAQRLAVLYMTGEWPKGVVDHRNGDRDCNAWENLRDCTTAQNNRNRSVRGCTWDWRKRRWTAQIVVDGKQRKLGSFKTEAEATAVYRAAAAKFHGEFSVTARPEPERKAA